MNKLCVKCECKTLLLPRNKFYNFVHQLKMWIILSENVVNSAIKGHSIQNQGYKFKCKRVAYKSCDSVLNFKNDILNASQTLKRYDYNIIITQSS